jgi:cysteine synthase
MIDLRQRIQAIDGLDRLWSPDQPLRIVPLPLDERINPFVDDGLRISAVMACDLPPQQNIKILSVLGMLLDAHESGGLVGVKELIEATSGNTGLALIALARYFGISRATLVVQSDLTVGKKDPIELSFPGKLSFILPDEGCSGIASARNRGKVPGFLNLGQYDNPHNSDLHEAYTGPEIFKVVPDICLYVGGIGTGGTTYGIMKFLRQHIENVKGLGVFCEPDEKVPGVRDFKRMEEITFPWRLGIDASVEINTRQAYLTTLWLSWLTGEMIGPSGGFAHAGLLDFMWSCKEIGKPYNLDDLRIKKGPKAGLIEVVEMIPDGFRPYADHFRANLPADFLNPLTSPLPETLFAW